MLREIQRKMTLEQLHIYSKRLALYLRMLFQKSGVKTNCPACTNIIFDEGGYFLAEKIKTNKNGVENNLSQMRYGGNLNDSNEYFRLD